MWLSKLRKKKTQYYLIGVIFTIAIALISISAIITMVTNTFVLEYYKGDNTPDLTVVTTKNSVIEKTEKWFETQGEEVRNYNKHEIYTTSTNLSLNGNINDFLLSYIIPIESTENLSNKIQIIEGDYSKKTPEKGEMWIPKTVAKFKGIMIGDDAEIIDNNGEKMKFKISAIINDSNQTTTGMGILYTYINEEDRKSLKSLQSAAMINMNCNRDSNKKVIDLTKYINEPIGGFIIDKSLYILNAIVAPSIMGGLSLISALLLVFVLVVIIRTNLKNNILKEHKAMGIYKTLGYTSKEIRRIYLYGYMIVSCISSFIGILISIPISNYVCNIIFNYLGEYRFDLTSLIIILIIFLLFNALVYVNLYGVLKSVNKLKPVNAINVGLNSSKKNFKKSLIKNNSSSFIMAINDIFKYKRNSLMILIIFILVFYISIFFLNIANSMLKIESNLHKWAGVPRADLVISAATDRENSIDEVKKYLDNDKRVKDFYLWNFTGQNKIIIDNSKYKIMNSILFPTTFDKFNEEDFSILHGRNPRNENEVALNISIMDENNLNIGDYITINVENKDREFLITGSYSSMLGCMQNLRLVNKVLSGNSKGNIAFVTLNNLESYKSMKEDLLNNFNMISVSKIYKSFRDAVSQTVEISIPVVIILLIGILGFTFLNIINILVTNSLDNKKNYGIMKSLGFDSKYIRRREMFRLLILGSIGVGGGLGINLLLSKGIFELLLGGVDGYIFNPILTVLYIILVFILIIILMYICTKDIKKISTVDLIME